ncbi:hypothetical protein SASPL_143927 [Salvia splendens]|uniref:DUF4216 domain-containing protein n=1 Tax=Salvia splendens TaxID=180675 RepID=A0A8X8ZAS3_SALSN|nr:hypothetical protein SASPL_143927 [Salvia splendens]
MDLFLDWIAHGELPSILASRDAFPDAMVGLPKSYYEADKLMEKLGLGVETYDTSKKKNFQLRASLLWTISDFPGYADLSRWSTQDSYLKNTSFGRIDDSSMAQLSMEKHRNNYEAICYKSRQDLEQMGIRPELHPITKERGKVYLRATAFTMSKKERTIFCQVLKNLKVPDGYASNISRKICCGTLPIGEDISTIILRCNGALDCAFGIFTINGRSLGKGTAMRLDDVTLTKAHQYVLFNCNIGQELNNLILALHVINWNVSTVKGLLIVSKVKRLKTNVDRFTLANFSNVILHNEPFILASEAEQVFYVEDPTESQWKVVVPAAARAQYDMEPIIDVETYLQSNICVPADSIESDDFGWVREDMMK